MRVANYGEFELIKYLTRDLSTSDKAVIKGIGDDAAVIRCNKHKYLLITCDMMIEGIHFLTDKITPFQLGYKALAVNLSDIAAMGGKPLYALISAGWPATLTIEYIDQIYKGIKKGADQFNVSIIGGDTSKSSQTILDLTVVGESSKPPIERSGASLGDLIAVTGTIGSSSAGLELLLLKNESVKISSSTKNFLINVHNKPHPRVSEALILSKSETISAMIDISDGLASEIKHICRESNVGAIVYENKIPVNDHVKIAGKILNKDYTEWVFYGGEDYELLFTIKQSKTEQFLKIIKNTDIQYSIIGEIVDKNDGVKVMQDDKKVPLTDGFDHFKSKI